MANLMPQLIQRFVDGAGVPLAGGKLYTYEAGTSTPLATYQNQDESTANTNPMIFDSNGEANIWLKDQAYKLVLTDSSDNILATRDGVAHIPAGSISSTDIADGAITAIKIASSAVTTAKIDNEAVTRAKIAGDAIDGTKIADDVIDSEHYVDGSIDNVHLAGGIAESKLAAPRKLQCRKFVTVGDNAVTMPSDTTYAWAKGMGGGGAGGTGGTGVDAFQDGGGGGAGGGASIFIGPFFFNFTAGESATVRVGAGGASAGADGEASRISALAGTFPELYFPGAEGGDQGPTSSADGVQASSDGGNLLIYDGHIDALITSCGPGGAGGRNSGSLMQAASQAPAYKILNGGTIAAGGAAGIISGPVAPNTDDDHGGGGGGGARSIFGNGGAGGDGQNNSGTGQTAGAAAASTSYGAGGGGGGGGREAGSGVGAAGGAGAGGTVWIYCITTESWEGTV